MAAQIGQNVCEAANKAKVGRVVALSSLGSDLEEGTVLKFLYLELFKFMQLRKSY